MKSVNLVSVNHGAEGTELCTAPTGAVKPGDTVETDWGRGVIEATVFTYYGDELFDFIRKHVQIHKVRAIIKFLEEEE